MIHVFNETKGTIVADHMRVAGGAWSKFWGLMGRRALPDGEALHITPCSSIHTFFMRFIMDAIFLDRDLRVVKVIGEMKPWRAALGGAGAHSVLELVGGAAAHAQVEPGDRLLFQQDQLRPAADATR